MKTETIVNETSLGLRLSQELKTALQEKAQTEGHSLSDYVKQILQSHLDRPDPELQVCTIQVNALAQRAVLERFLTELNADRSLFAKPAYQSVEAFMVTQLAKSLKEQADGSLFEEEDQEMLDLAAEFLEMT